MNGERSPIMLEPKPSSTLTNKHGYPESIVRAIANDTYSRGDSEFSATSLLQPPRISALTDLYKDQIVTDVDDRLFILYGHMGHALLERASNKLHSMVERRFFGVIDGVKISAQIDNLSLEDDQTLIDWKFTTVYGFMEGTPPKREWIAQMNIQLELLRQNGIEAKALKIYGMLRDWRPKEAKNNPNYPKKIAYHNIPIVDREKTQSFIKQRIQMHRQAREKLPLCSTEDNWNGNRCRGYCEVAKFCTQFNGEIKK
jgi:hypothetical protein